MTGHVQTTIHETEMADLILLLNDLASGMHMTVARRRRAVELRDTIIAGTPLEQRIGSAAFPAAAPGRERGYYPTSGPNQAWSR